MSADELRTVALHRIELLEADDSPLAVALLKIDRERASLFVSADYARTFGELAGLVGPEIIHDLEFPEEQRLRALAPGWPEDWSPEDAEIVSSMVSDVRSMGWQAFRERADEAARHAEELGDA